MISETELLKRKGVITHYNIGSLHFYFSSLIVAPKATKTKVSVVC